MLHCTCRLIFVFQLLIHFSSSRLFSPLHLQLMNAFQMNSILPSQESDYYLSVDDGGFGEIVDTDCRQRGESSGGRLTQVGKSRFHWRSAFVG